MASRDWDGLPLQSHFLAAGYAQRGHRVFYINQTLQKWPRPVHFMKRFRPGRDTGKVDSFGNTLPGIVPVTLLLGPPEAWLRPLNRYLIRRGLRRLDIVSPALVTWVPTYNCLDVISELQPVRTAYVNYHHFEADDVLPALLAAERILVEQVDLLFSDSLFLRQRLDKISGGRTVHRSLPGVHYDLFRAAWRGDEIERSSVIMYFGDIGPHLDLAAYNALAERYRVVMVGVAAAKTRALLSPRIEVRPAVSVFDLPRTLAQADVLATLYRDSPYMRGVIPSKFFECLATGKPLLVSGLAEARTYADCVHLVDDGAPQALAIMGRLAEIESAAVRARRDELAREADWPARFEHFARILAV